MNQVDTIFSVPDEKTQNNVEAATAATTESTADYSAEIGSIISSLARKKTAWLGEGRR